MKAPLTFAPTVRLEKFVDMNNTDYVPELFFTFNVPASYYEFMFMSVCTLMKGRYQDELSQGHLAYQIWLATFSNEESNDEIYEEVDKD